MQLARDYSREDGEGSGCSAHGPGKVDRSVCFNFLVRREGKEKERERNVNGRENVNQSPRMHPDGG